MFKFLAFLRFSEAARIAVHEQAESTAVAGDECDESLVHASVGCQESVMWAKSEGIHQYPQWYPGLTASSSLEDFHRYISELPRCGRGQPAPCAAHECTPPCYRSGTQCSIALSMSEPSSDWGYGGCSGSLGFTATENVCTPDGSGGANLVTGGSSTRYNGCPSPGGVLDVTHYDNPFCTGTGDHSYVSVMDGSCLQNCCNKDASRCDLSCGARASPVTCDHVSPDSECARQLRWARKEGIRNHPDWYPGLTEDSSASDFQRYLSGLRSCYRNIPPCYQGGTADRCPAPCS